MSSKKTTTKYLFIILPVLLAGIIFMGIIYSLWTKVNTNSLFKNTLIELAPVFIGICVVFALALMAYLYHTVFSLKNLKNAIQPEMHSATQKMHNVRKIIEVLLKSNMWLPGLKECIDEDYAGLTFFEVKNFYKGKSKIAIEFLQENHNYSETENLYLELKSLLLTHPKQGRTEEKLTYPTFYSPPIVEHWIQHKVGTGLWYYFGYKFANFKDVLDLDSISEKHQDKIISLANATDPVVFEENSFNEIFLSKLGEYIAKNILPNLYKERAQNTLMLPRSVQYFSLLLSLLIIVGIIAPLITLLLALPVIILIISYAFTGAFLGYISLSFYQFLKLEISR